MEKTIEHKCIKEHSKIIPVTERGYKMKRVCKVCEKVMEEDAKISTFEGFIRAWFHGANGKKKVLGNYKILEKKKQIIYVGSGRNIKDVGTDVLALKLKDGRIIGNASRLERCGSYSRGTEAPAQRVMFSLSMAMIPFNVFDEAKLNIQTAKVIEQGKEEDFLLPEMEWNTRLAVMQPADARMDGISEIKVKSDNKKIVLKQERGKISIYARTKKGAIKIKEGCQVMKTVNGWNYTYMDKELMENRHFVGAMLLSVGKNYFIFDIDRVEINNYRFNPFLTQLPCKVNSLAEAYEVLKPKEVIRAEKKGIKVLRQGEWFLIPSKKKQVPKIPELPKVLKDKLAKKPLQKFYDLENYQVEFDFEDYDDDNSDDNKTILKCLIKDDYNFKRVNKKYRKNIISRTRDYIKDCKKYMIVLGKKKDFDSKFNLYEYGGELKAGDNRPNTVGKLFIYNGISYVKGKVEHTGREHETIDLQNWHIAVPNTAIKSFTIVGDID